MPWVPASSRSLAIPQYSGRAAWQLYDEHWEKQYWFFSPMVDEVVEEYLRGRGLHEGFARVRCTNSEAGVDFCKPPVKMQ